MVVPRRLSVRPTLAAAVVAVAACAVADAPPPPPRVAAPGRLAAPTPPQAQVADAEAEADPGDAEAEASPADAPGAAPAAVPAPAREELPYPTGPAGRERHGLVSCTTGVLLLGGHSQEGCVRDLAPGMLEWRGAEWRHHDVPGALLRCAPALAWDTHRRRVVLFGGRLWNDPLGDTWEWDGSGWTERAAAPAPAPRDHAALAYDATRDVVVLFGGQGASEAPLGDTWVWDGARWERLAPPAAPPARFGHAMAYDAARREVVLFGGRTGDRRAREHLRDTWTWDGRTWTPREPLEWPPSRWAHALAYDARRRRVVLHGGEHLRRFYRSREVREPLGDTWEWDGGDWARVSAAVEPPARSHHGLAWDPARQVVVCAGGVRGGPLLDDMWTWDGATWTQVDGHDWSPFTGDALPLPSPPRLRGLSTRHERAPGDPTPLALATLARLAHLPPSELGRELARMPAALRVEVGRELAARWIDVWGEDEDEPRFDRAALLVHHAGGALRGTDALADLWTFQDLLPGSVLHDHTRARVRSSVRPGPLLRCRRNPRVHARVPFVLVRTITERLRAGDRAACEGWVEGLLALDGPPDQRRCREALLFLLGQPATVHGLRALLDSELLADRVLAQLVAAAAIPELALEDPAAFERTVEWAADWHEAPPVGLVSLDALDARLAAWLDENAGRLERDPATGLYQVR
ncbi:MAG: hypothetical protein M9894_17250 [Planctomycetes bacterium]|nr:hypothetical protein [Planctomycetota bacterium]